jgi:hypothetical protein
MCVRARALGAVFCARASTRQEQHSARGLRFRSMAVRLIAWGVHVCAAHVVLLEDVLHEGLAALELGGCLVGAKGKDARLFQLIDDTGRERILGTYHHEVDGVGFRPLHHLLRRRQHRGFECWFFKPCKRSRARLRLHGRICQHIKAIDEAIEWPRTGKRQSCKQRTSPPWGRRSRQYR